MAGCFSCDSKMNKVGDFGSRSAASKQTSYIIFFTREQTRSDIPIGRQSNSRTVAAEGIRHRSDQADLPACAVSKAIPPRCLTSARLVYKDYWKGRIYFFPDLGSRDEMFSIPHMPAIEGHEFDESDG